MTTSSAPAGNGLRSELRAVEHDFPQWHCWLSDEGRIWAVTPHNEVGGSGTTVTAGSAEGVTREIARTEHEWLLAGHAA